MDIVAEDDVSVGNTDQFKRRKNIFYRTIHKLKKKPTNRSNPAEKEEVSLPATPKEECNLKDRRLDEVYQSDRTQDNESSKGDKISALQVFQRNGKRSFSESQINEESKMDNRKSRPLSIFTFKTRRESAPPDIKVNKPSDFREVKLKKVEVAEKTYPKTTEKYKLFEGVYEVSLRTFEGKLKPYVSWSHPPLGSHEDRTLLATVKSIPDFCFPDIDSTKFEQNTKKMKCKLMETYAFVQTDMCAKRRFGYCRRFKGKPDGKDTKVSRLKSRVSKKLGVRVWCVITQLGCFDTFNNIFDEVGNKWRNENLAAVYTFLKAIGESPAPLPGNSLPVRYISQSAQDNEMEHYDVSRPQPQERLGLLMLANLMKILGKSLTITIMFALFMEHKVLVMSKTLSSLTSILHGLTSLLHPLVWECIYTPIVPRGLRRDIRDFVQSPSPYIIGILKEDYEKLNLMELKETKVLVVDLTDKKLIDLREDRKPEIPKKVFNDLRDKLRAAKKSTNKIGELSKVWEDFIGGYLQPMIELCKLRTDNNSKDTCRILSAVEYMEHTKSMDPSGKFTISLLESQMVQQYLQNKKPRIEIKRDDLGDL